MIKIYWFLCKLNYLLFIPFVVTLVISLSVFITGVITIGPNDNLVVDLIVLFWAFILVMLIVTLLLILLGFMFSIDFLEDSEYIQKFFKRKFQEREQSLKNEESRKRDEKIAVDNFIKKCKTVVNENK